MRFAKRLLLCIAVNFLVFISISGVLSLFHVQPYLTAHGIDFVSLMVFCFAWGMGGALISLALSRVMAKWLMRVQIIPLDTRDPQLRSLLSTVHDLAKRASLQHPPQVGVYEAAEPNAFATGPSRRRALVAVSTGLLQRMSSNELEGVLAHELSHVANGDMVTMTLLQGVTNAFVMFLARACAFALTRGGGRARDEQTSVSYVGYATLVYLFEILFMLLGSMGVAWFSRWREFRADRGGAEVAGKEKMIRALESLLAMQRTQRQSMPRGMSHDGAAQPAFEALQIASSRRRTGWMRLFCSHPPLEERISHLQLY